MLTFFKSRFKIYQSSAHYYMAQIQATIVFFSRAIGTSLKMTALLNSGVGVFFK